MLFIIERHENLGSDGWLPTTRLLFYRVDVLICNLFASKSWVVAGRQFAQFFRDYLNANMSFLSFLNLFPSSKIFFWVEFKLWYDWISLSLGIRIRLSLLLEDLFAFLNNMFFLVFGTAAVNDNSFDLSTSTTIALVYNAKHFLFLSTLSRGGRDRKSRWDWLTFGTNYLLQFWFQRRDLNFQAYINFFCGLPWSLCFYDLAAKLECLRRNSSVSELLPSRWYTTPCLVLAKLQSVFILLKFKILLELS